MFHDFLCGVNQSLSRASRAFAPNCVIAAGDGGDDVAGGGPVISAGLRAGNGWRAGAKFVPLAVAQARPVAAAY